MDYRRSGARTMMREFQGGPLVPGVWFRVPKDTPVFRSENVFRCRLYDDLDGMPWSGIGEQISFDCTGAINDQPWYSGRPPAPYTGRTVCGALDVWSRGGIPGVDPEFVTDDFGVPPCCGPLVYGGVKVGAIPSATFSGYSLGGSLLAGAIPRAVFNEGLRFDGTLRAGASPTFTGGGGYHLDGTIRPGAVPTFTGGGGYSWAGAIPAGAMPDFFGGGGQLLAGAIPAGAQITGHWVPIQRAFTNNGNQSGTWTATKPTGTAAGDFVLAFIYTSGTATLPTSVSGTFTQIGSQAIGATQSLTIWSRTASASEPTYQWTTAAGGQSSYVLVTIKNANHIENGGNVNTGTGTTVTALSCTPTFAPTYLLCAMAWAANTTPPGNPTGMATVATAGTTLGALRVFDQTISTSGSTGTRTSTIGASAAWGSVLMDAYQ